MSVHPATTMPSHLIDDEVLIITDGGEMPEVTLYSCLHFLQTDPEGPQISVTGHDLMRMKQAVVDRYLTIIRRDLTLENRDKGLYRGLARSTANWQRLSRFCRREGFDPSPLAIEIRALLHHFVTVEYAEVSTQTRQTCINCSLSELTHFFEQIDLDQSRLPDGWQTMLCHR